MLCGCDIKVASAIKRHIVCLDRKKEAYVLAIIDESGDPSFKSGSSDYFLIAMVIIDSFEEAEKISAAIDNARKDCRLRREFKFSSCKDQAKECFFNTVCKYDFKIRAFVARKNLIRENYLRNNPKKFYNFCLKMMLKHDDNTLNDAIVKIDGSGSRVFRSTCSSYLRQGLPQGKIREVKFKDSKNDNLVQLADMTVGAIARRYNSPEKPNVTKWRNMIKRKIDEEWGFK